MEAGSCWRETSLGPLIDIAGWRNVTRPADLGYVAVPRDHAAPFAGNDYLLRVARFRGAAGGRKKPPVFLLLGGPRRTNDLYEFIDAPRTAADAAAAIGIVDAATRHRDLVLIDHRGSAGCIHPRLAPLGIGPSLPCDRPVGPDERRAAYARTCHRIADRWREVGVDLCDFSADQVADDIDLVRRALGYEAISLVGISNGTYRARAFLRRHGGNVVDALFLVSHGYSKVPKPLHSAAALARISRDLAAAPVIGAKIPDLSILLDELYRYLDDSRPVVPVLSAGAGKPVSVALDGNDLVPFFWKFFSGTTQILKGPARMFRALEGDLSEIARTALSYRICGEDMDDISAYELAFSGFAMPQDVMENRLEASAMPFLNRELSDGLPTAWPFGRDDCTVFDSHVPTTYVMGEWDIRTPLEGIAGALHARDTVWTVPGLGHAGVSDFIAKSLLAWQEQRPLDVFPETLLDFDQNFSSWLR